MFKKMRQEESFLRVDMYTPYDEASDEQKKHLKKLFRKLLLDLLLVEVCIAAIYLFNMPIVGLVGVFFGISAFNGVRVYGSAVMGEGLHTAFLFFENRIRIIDDFGGREFAYRFITDGVYFEKGLFLRFKDGSKAGISLDAMEQSEDGNGVVKLMSSTLKNKFKNAFEEENYRLKKEAEERERAEKRNDALGYKMADAVYEPDSKDFRDYCRLIMNTGGRKKLLDVLFPVLLAFCVALPIFSFITGEYMLDAVMYVLLILAGLLFFLSKIGIGAPAKSRFAVKKHEVIKIYLHYDGISVKTKNNEELYLWRDVDGCLYHPDIGMSFDLKDVGTVFVPADIVERETAESVMKRAEPMIMGKGERTDGKNEKENIR